MPGIFTVLAALTNLLAALWHLRHAAKGPRESGLYTAMLITLRAR